jgi:hypothetical protein
MTRSDTRRHQFRLWVTRGTIWDVSLLEEVPRRFRPIYTTVLPIKYALFALFGIIGTLTTIPTIVDLTSVDYSDIWTAMLGLTGLVSLAGLIWRHEQLELYCSIALIIGFSTYPVASIMLWIVEGDLQNAALAVGLWGFLVLPMWRTVDLVRTIRRRREGQPRG